MNRLATISFILMVASTAIARVIRYVDADHYPRYAYEYSVNDPKTKDIKDHWEAREGDFVKGAYSLVEPDGKRRVVDYWADDAHGFNADVKRLGESVHWPAIKKEPAPIEEIVPVTYSENDVAAELPIENAGAPESNAAPPVQDEDVKPLTPPANYGFGSGGNDAPPGQLYTSVDGTGSLRWDSKTGSYGGWVPLRRKEKLHAIIFNKKYVDGKLHQWAIGPISLVGRTLVFKVKH